MENRKRKKFITVFLIVLLAVSVLLTGSLLSYAAYTNSSRAKRVVATHERSGMLYSSNYLLAHVDNPLANRRVIYSSSEDTPAVTVLTVCNYSQGNPSVTHPQDIRYNLNAKLVVLTSDNDNPVRDAVSSDVGSKTISLKLGNTTKTLSSSNLSISFLGNTLARNTTSTDSYVLAFSADCNNDSSGLCVQIEAVPVLGEGSINDITTIDGIFNASVAVKQTVSSWKGYFSDRGAEDNPTVVTLPSDFDGFNYVISGLGEGTVTLSWDNTQLDISQVFLDENSLTPQTTGNTTTVSFSVDSDVKDRYGLQFYYNKDSSITSWSLVKSYVTFSYSSQNQ